MLPVQSEHAPNGCARHQTPDPRQSGAATAANWLSVTQGLFYLATGVWPLVSMRTFERVTGPKTDKWLVKTAGVQITAIGSTLTLAGARKHVSQETRLLAIASACGLASIDVIYAAKRRIAPVYLLDAAAQLALIGGWQAIDERSRREQSRSLPTSADSQEIRKDLGTDS